MARITRRQVSDLTVAVAAVTVAFVIHLSFRRYTVETPFLLFFGAIMVAAWRGGLWPGLAATGLSTLLAWYFLLPAYDSFKLPDGWQATKLLMFAFEGALISALAEEMKRQAARARLHAGARSEADAARERSEGQLRLVTDALPALVSYIDRDHTYRFVNEAYQHWFDRPADQMVGRALPDVLGEAAYEHVRPHLEAALAGRRASYEAELTYARGGTRFVHADYVPDVAPDGSVRGVVALVTDQTARRRAEDAARVLADAGNVLASSLDHQVTLDRLARLAVPAIADLCNVDIRDAGADPAAPNGGLRRLAIVAADAGQERLAREIVQRYPHRPMDAAVRVLSTGEPVLIARIDDDQLRRFAVDEDHLDLLRRLAPRSAIIAPLVARGRTLGVISFTSARSGRVYGEADVRLAEELARRAALAVDNAQLYTESQEANRAKDQFLATVSHELRTPLNAILGWAQLLQMGGVDRADAPRGLETIERNAKAQAQLVDDLLDISRIVTGKLRLNVAATDVRPPVEAAIESVRHAASAKHITLEARFDPLGTPIVADPARLQQVVWNLLSNAIKFTPPGGCVDVTVTREPDGGGIDEAVVTVADTGPGIDGAFLPHVFDRFRQADGSSTRQHGGLGIGLSIARHLVELLGGGVAAPTRPPPTRGAIFQLRLPLAKASTATAMATSPLSEKVDPRSGDGDGMATLDGVRVLVVDDEPDTLDLIARVLRRSRAHVTTARSAAEAVAILDRARPDVLLSDIAMPGEDGLALIRRVREMTDARGRSLPAAALTAFARDEDRTRALAAGYQVHVAKPVEPAKLTAVVAELAGRTPA
jgi:PAS domain S-box-containing protein